MKTLCSIGGTTVFIDPNGVITWTGKADIDNDGSGGNSEHDPDFQPHTSLRHLDGSSLNSETEFGIVIPESMIDLITPHWLGSQAYVTYQKKTAPAVVYDFGPRTKIGEISVALARFLGIDPSPTKEIAVSHGVSYEVHPGTPAIVGSNHYNLQRA